MNLISILLLNFMSLVMSHQFSVCPSNANIVLSEIELTPDIPIAGQDLNIKLKGTTAVNLNENMKLQFDVSALGIKVISEETSICDYVEDCNIEPGNFSLSINQAIPTTVPLNIVLKNQIKIKNSNSIDGCFEVDTKINQHLKEVHMKILFESWKKEHKKQYDSLIEHNQRYSIFKTNFEKIKQYNSVQHPGDVILAMNHLGDLTKDEYIKTLNPINIDRNKKTNYFRTLIKSIPDTKDWVTKMTSIRSPRLSSKPLLR